MNYLQLSFFKSLHQSSNVYVTRKEKKNIFLLRDENIFLTWDENIFLHEMRIFLYSSTGQTDR